VSESCRSISQLFGLVEDECGFLEVLKFFIERELNQDVEALTKKRSLANQMALNFFQLFCSDYVKQVFELPTDEQTTVKFDDIGHTNDPSQLHNIEEVELFLDRLYKSVDLLPAPVRHCLAYLYQYSVQVGSDPFINLKQWAIFRLLVPGLINRAQYYESNGDVACMLKCISLAKLLRDVLSTRSDLFSKDLATDHAQRMEKYLKSVAAFHPHPTTATFQFECVRTKQSITKVLISSFLNFHFLCMKK
jgi:hypothetical protein